MKPAPPVTRIIASCSFILGTGRLDIFSLSPPPQPSPTRGEGALLLPPPLWGRVGVGGKEEKMSYLPMPTIKCSNYSCQIYNSLREIRDRNQDERRQNSLGRLSG